MFIMPDNPSEHESNMGNTLPTKTELEDPEIHTYLSVYDYVIPFIAIFIVLVNFTVVISSGLLIKKGKYILFFFNTCALIIT